MSLMIVVMLATKEVVVVEAMVAATALRVLMAVPVVARARLGRVPHPPPGGHNRSMDTRRRLPGRQQLLLLQLPPWFP